jgi:hypothetical protein
VNLLGHFGGALVYLLQKTNVVALYNKYFKALTFVNRMLMPIRGRALSYIHTYIYNVCIYVCVYIYILQSEGTVKVMRDKSTEVAELKEQVQKKFKKKLMLKKKTQLLKK